MKQIYNILSFLMLLILLTSEDCSDTGREISVEDQQMAMFEEIEVVFEKDQLESKELKAFEIRSLQMMEDLVDYLNIYSDSSLYLEFRLHAKQMISELFVTQQKFDSFLSQFQLVEDEDNETLYHKNDESISFELSSASIYQNLKHQPDLTYSGTIEFVLSSSVPGHIPNKNQLGVIIKKSDKLFGDEMKQVWEVFYGDITY